MEKVGDDGDKPALHFVGKDKALILNKTNTNMIAYRYGQETDAWMGQQIGLHVEPVQFKDKIVDAIRVQLPTEEPAVGQLQAAPVADPEQSAVLGKAKIEALEKRVSLSNRGDQPPTGFDDDIPF